MDKSNPSQDIQDHQIEVMKQGEINFDDEWKAGNAAEKLGLMERVKKQYQKKDRTLYKVIGSRYEELLDHPNANISSCALDLLELQIKDQNNWKDTNPKNIAVILLSVTLLKKERKQQAVEQLLNLVENQSNEFIEGTKEVLKKKDNKILVETLRFLQMLIIKEDQKKLNMLQELGSQICSLAAEYPVAQVRQTALDFVIKMGMELGSIFIREWMPLLKSTQRVQLAKRLNERGIADEEIDAFEQKKAFCAKDQKAYTEYKLLYYQSYQDAVKQEDAQKASDSIKFAQAATFSQMRENERKAFTNNVAIMNKNQSRIQYLKNLNLLVEKLNQSQGKEKVYIIKEVHERFMKGDVDDLQLLQHWEFAKYLSFSNPRGQLQLLEILKKYLEIMQMTEERKSSFYPEMTQRLKKLVRQMIINLAKGAKYFSDISNQIIITFLKDQKLFQFVLEQFLDSLHSKADSILSSCLNLISSTLLSSQFDKSILLLDTSKQILFRIVEVASDNSQDLKGVALQALVAATKQLRADIYVYADKLNRFQYSRFQNLVLDILAPIEKEPIKEKVPAKDENLIDKKSNQNSQFFQRKEEMKLLLCHKNINSESFVASNLASSIEKEKLQLLSVKEAGEQQLDSIHCETTIMLQDLIVTGGENIANNSVKLIGIVSNILTPEDQLIFFKTIFEQFHNLHKNEALKTLNNIFDLLGQQQLVSFIFNKISTRVQEDTGIIFLSHILSTLHEDSVLKLTDEAIKILLEETSMSTKVLTTDLLAKIWLLKGEEVINQSMKRLANSDKQIITLTSKIEKSYKKYIFLEQIKNNQKVPDEVKSQKKDQLNEKEQNERPKKIKQISFKEFRKQQQLLKDEEAKKQAGDQNETQKLKQSNDAKLEDEEEDDDDDDIDDLEEEDDQDEEEEEYDDDDAYDEEGNEKERKIEQEDEI